MPLDGNLSAAEELSLGIQLHANAVETSKTAFADTVVKPLMETARLIGDGEIVLGDTPKETAKKLEEAGVSHASSVAARVHVIADGEQPSIYL